MTQEDHLTAGAWATCGSSAFFIESLSTINKPDQWESRKSFPQALTQLPLPSRFPLLTERKRNGLQCRQQPIVCLDCAALWPHSAKSPFIFSKHERYNSIENLTSDRIDLFFPFCQASIRRQCIENRMKNIHGDALK